MFWDTGKSFSTCDQIDTSDTVVCRRITFYEDGAVGDEVLDDSACVSDGQGQKPSATRIKDMCEHPPSLVATPVGPYKAPHQIGGGDFPRTHLPYPSDPAAYCTKKSYRQVTVKCMQGSEEVAPSYCFGPSDVVASDDGTFWQAGPEVSAGCEYQWSTDEPHGPSLCFTRSITDSTCVNTNSQYGYFNGYDAISQGASGYDDYYSRPRCSSPQPKMYDIDGQSYNAGACLATRKYGPWRPFSAGCGRMEFTRKSRCEFPHGVVDVREDCGYDGEPKSAVGFVPCLDEPTGEADSGTYRWATGNYDFNQDFFECGDNVGVREVRCVDEGSGKSVADALCTAEKPSSRFNNYKVCPYPGSGAEQPR